MDLLKQQPQRLSSTMQNLPHYQLVDALQRGDLRLRVDAHRAMQHLREAGAPTAHRIAHQTLTGLVALSLPASLAAMHMAGFATGFAMLIIVLPLLVLALRETDAGFIVDHCLDSDRFYRYALDSRLVFIEPIERRHHKKTATSIS